MQSIMDKLQSAVALHQKSQLQKARELYSEVLEIEPDNVDATHLLGVLDLQAGDNVQALERLSKASRLNPTAVNILSNLGTAQRRLGKFEEALKTYQKAISIDPKHAESYHNMGIALKANSRVEEAAKCFRKAIELKPNYQEAIRSLTQIEIASGDWQRAMATSELAAKSNPEDAAAQLRLAECQMRMRQHADAVKSFEAVLKIEPNNPAALNGLGLAFKSTGNLEKAEQILLRVLEVDKGSFPALCNLGTVYQGMKKFDEAIGMYHRALEIKPESAEVLNNLGGALKEQGKVEEALKYCKRAVEINPNLPSAHCNLAAAIQLHGDVEGALQGYYKALEIQGDLMEAHLGLGSAFAQLGRLKEARRCYSRALFFDPLHAEARLYRGIIGLLDGDLENAWSDYEWRWRMSGNNGRKVPAPRWDGSPLKDKTLFIYAEQGLGDTLQFIRYAALVKAQGGKVVAEIQKPLLPLLARLPWLDQIIAQGDPVPPFSVYCPMLSLPGTMGTTLDNIPNETPYLTADPMLIEKWSEVIRSIPGKRIGIAWQGNPDFKQDRFRSIPLKEFEPLFGTPNTSFVSMQKGFGSEQIEKLSDRTKLKVFEGVDTEEGAFMDTSAILQNLDILITSDSAIAHLAGGLGVKTWLVLPFAPDWRWRLGTSSCDWYPSMRLFRQTKFGSWTEVFHEVQSELTKFVSQS